MAESGAPVPLFRRHTPRPRLTRLLDESTAQALLLIAPPGYGKTTLAMEWLVGRDDAVWYRATAASADVAAFSVGLGEVVAPIVPGAGERLRQRLRVAEAPERAARPLAELLAEDLAGWPAGALIVIDDYHLVTASAPVEEFMDWLLTLAPIRVLVTSRRRPMWASARRVLYGELTEIGREQLAMNREEARQVLGDRSDETVGALVSQAEGWPALIGLAALSASDELPKEGVSETLFRYFAEEVLRQEEPDVQRLMLLASVPAVLNARVAREVLGFPEPESTLERLVEAGLLHAGGPDELRFHPLVRDFLRRKLEAEEPELFRRLSRDATKAALESGHWEDAIEHALATDDINLAAEITGKAAPALLSSGRLETVERWLSACGAALLDEAGAALAQAEVVTLRGRHLEAAGLARQLAEGLPSASTHASRAWFLAGHAFYLASQSEAARECHRQARDLAREEGDLKRALWGLFLSESELESSEAPTRLTELEQLTEGDINTRLRVAAGRLALGTNQATFAGSWSLVEPFIPLAQYATDPAAGSNFLAQVAYLNVARGHYGLAKRLADKALRMSSDLHHHFATDSCLLYRAAAEIGLRQFRQARKTIGGLTTETDGQIDPYLDTWRVVVQMKLALCECHPADALTASASALAFHEAPRTTQGELLGIKSIALATVGDPEGALQAVKLAREGTNAIEAVFFSRFGELLADLVSGELAVDSQRRVLDQLFDDCVQADFLDSFVVTYRAWPPLLRYVSQDGPRLSRMYQVVLRANDRALAQAARLPDPIFESQQERGQLLTPREWEVLSLMGEGLTNSEIASRLFITKSTTKVHVHHILKKLGVKTRIQAVLFWERFLRKAS